MKESYLLKKENKEKHFGSGAWVDEPDLVEFEHRGLKCVVQRVSSVEWPNFKHMFGGHLCGYVACDEDLYDSNEDLFDEIEVHGGITFSSVLPELNTFCLGFDCAHAWDIVPSMEKMYLDRGVEFHFKSDLSTYKNMSYVIAETLGLAEQIFKIQESLK